MIAPIERVSVEPSRRCAKGCSFCYNGSGPAFDGTWSVADLVELAASCAAGGVRAVSFGGGEPLEYAGINDVLRALDGVLFRSLTTNGLLLDDPGVRAALLASRPDKVHVWIHAPENSREVARVIAQVTALATDGAHIGMTSGVNLLVRGSRLADARRATQSMYDAGIDVSRIVFLPMRGDDTPSPEDVAGVAGGARFQSMTCLRACGKSPRFVSIDSDRRVAWCSYTRARRTLSAPTYDALIAALRGADDSGELGLIPCDGGNLVRRSASSLPLA